MNLYDQTLNFLQPSMTKLYAAHLQTRSYSPKTSLNPSLHVCAAVGKLSASASHTAATFLPQEPPKEQ